MKITSLPPKIPNKYILIKTYPGSPNLGYEVDLSKVTIETIEGFNNTLTGKWRILRSTIPNNPEFWQEVIDTPVKEYEILTVKLLNNKVFKLNELTHIDNSLLTDSEIVNFNYTINSIKRLSDGEN